MDFIIFFLYKKETKNQDRILFTFCLDAKSNKKIKPMKRKMQKLRDDF